MGIKCIKAVVDLNCNYCGGAMIRFGMVKCVQRYRCKCCKRTQRREYSKNAYCTGVNDRIAAHVREGCGIRSISRLLKISANTVVRRIRFIAENIKKPVIAMGHNYEVDELKLKRRTICSSKFLFRKLETY